MLAGLNMRMGAVSYLYHHKWVRLARQLSLIMAVWLAAALVRFAARYAAQVRALWGCLSCWLCSAAGR